MMYQQYPTGLLALNMMQKGPSSGDVVPGPRAGGGNGNNGGNGNQSQGQGGGNGGNTGNGGKPDDKNKKPDPRMRPAFLPGQQDALAQQLNEGFGGGLSEWQGVLKQSYGPSYGGGFKYGVGGGNGNGNGKGGNAPIDPRTGLPFKDPNDPTQVGVGGVGGSGGAGTGILALGAGWR